MLLVENTPRLHSVNSITICRHRATINGLWLNDSRSVGIVPQRFVWRASDQFKRQSSSESSQELGDWSPKGNTEDSHIRALTYLQISFPGWSFSTCSIIFNLTSFHWGPSGTSQIAAVIRGQGMPGSSTRIVTAFVTAFHRRRGTQFVKSSAHPHPSGARWKISPGSAHLQVSNGIHDRVSWRKLGSPKLGSDLGTIGSPGVFFNQIFSICFKTILFWYIYIYSHIDHISDISDRYWQLDEKVGGDAGDPFRSSVRTSSERTFFGRPRCKRPASKKRWMLPRGLRWQLIWIIFGYFCIFLDIFGYYLILLDITWDYLILLDIALVQSVSDSMWFDMWFHVSHFCDKS